MHTVKVFNSHDNYEKACRQHDDVNEVVTHVVHLITFKTSLFCV